ncbi:uncharacterized protein LOC112084120 [Eutrema salsugineum]|uniref:uncharacterized protein LOC112084120 n=1 Tax=Eutrema salsugineum TaxID=72664 RepID=UPI000CED3109|nr:uncharacterized protein LOC112084120 [Eutrema salsugineum]
MMAASILSSIIFFLVFILLSLFVDGKAIASHMEQRKLSGSNEIIAMRRNLAGNEGSKITAPPSRSQHSGQKNTQNEPSKTHPDHATPRKYLTYKSLCNPKLPGRSCIGAAKRSHQPCTIYNRCKITLKPLIKAVELWKLRCKVINI